LNFTAFSEQLKLVVQRAMEVISELIADDRRAWQHSSMQDVISLASTTGEREARKEAGRGMTATAASTFLLPLLGTSIAPECSSDAHSMIR